MKKLSLAALFMLLISGCADLLDQTDDEECEDGSTTCEAPIGDDTPDPDPDPDPDPTVNNNWDEKNWDELEWQ